LAELLHPDIDGDVDRGLRLARRQRARRIRVFEREILDVLPEHVERWCLLLLRLRRRRAAIGRGHATLPPSPAGIPHRAAWLTQGAKPDKDHESVFLRLRGLGGISSCSCASSVSEIWCHSPGLRSITSGLRAARCFFTARPIAAAISRRPAGRSSSAPTRSVIKPGKTRRIPPTVEARPGVSRLMARIPCALSVLRKRSKSRRPAWRSTRTPAAEGAKNSIAAHSHPIASAIATKTANSAAGSRITPIKAHFTKDIGRKSYVTKVGAGVRIVYGPDRTMASPTRALDRLGCVPT